MTIIKKFTNNKYWRGCGEQGALLLLVGMYIGKAIMENSLEVPQKTKNSFHMILQSYSWVYTQINYNFKRYMPPYGSFYNSQDMQVT